MQSPVRDMPRCVCIVSTHFADGATCDVNLSYEKVVHTVFQPHSLLSHQALLPNLSSYGAQALYATVRGSTDCGDIIFATSNGFVVDPSPPSLEVIGTGENAIEHAQSLFGQSHINHTMYQVSPSFSALWWLNDDESGAQTGKVVSIGSYPGGGDILAEHDISDDSIRGNLETEDGVPHYVTVTGYNRAGLGITVSGRSIALDTSPPTLGQVCYFPQVM